MIASAIFCVTLIQDENNWLVLVELVSVMPIVFLRGCFLEAARVVENLIVRTYLLWFFGLVENSEKNVLLLKQCINYIGYT